MGSGDVWGLVCHLFLILKLVMFSNSTPGIPWDTMYVIRPAHIECTDTFASKPLWFPSFHPLLSSLEAWKYCPYCKQKKMHVSHDISNGKHCKKNWDVKFILFSPKKLRLGLILSLRPEIILSVAHQHFLYTRTLIC